MLEDRWICDRTPTERFPDYTRGNAAEVMADPASPLGWTFCCEPGMVRGCVDGFEQMGVFDTLEYDSEWPESFGLFGGYFYNSLTQSRLFGIRSGAGWEAIDNTFFDPASQEIPPYVASDWHDSERHSKKLEQTIGFCLSTTSVPEIERQKLEAKAVRDSRPDLSTQTNEQLLGRAKSLQRHLRAQFSQVVWGALGSSIGQGILTQLIGEMDPDAIPKLMTGIGDVDSADIANQIFALSRLVNASSELSEVFDGDRTDVLTHIAGLSSTEAADFTSAVEAFMYEHGSRGPNEWDPYAWSYESKPSMLVEAIAHARGAGDESNPMQTIEKGAAERARLIEHFSGVFAQDEEALAMFTAAVNSLGVFMAARERCKGSNIRVVGEVRESFLELGRRATADGHLEHERQVFMLLADEVDQWVADPASMSSTLADREKDYLELYDLDPPYVVDGDVPPLSEWPRKGDGDVEQVAVGDVLSGVSGSPGTATGIARILLDPTDPMALGPGEILITVSTDPSWTPLFLAAGGVVTDIGAVGTHAVIVSRELAIPCVPSIANASRRIPDGATITVDGTAGTVTIDALP